MTIFFRTFAPDMQSNTKKQLRLTDLLKYVVPFIISIGLCYLLFTGIDFNEMIGIIRRDCDFRWIIAGLFLSLFSYLFRALRWDIQLRALGINTPLYILVISMFGNYAVNLVFPRLGEIWRSGFIAQRQKAQFTTVLGSLVAERLADTITVALITLTAFILAAGPISDYLSANVATFQSFRNIILSPWTICAVILLSISLYWLLAAKTTMPSVLKIRHALRQLWQGFAVITKMPGKARWLLWTVCLWGCYFTQLLIAMLAFPSLREMIATGGLTPALVAFALSSISMGVPSNGGIGPWQWAIIFALGIYGIASATAGAFANVVLGSQTLAQIILGIITFIIIAADRRKQNMTPNL